MLFLYYNNLIIWLLFIHYYYYSLLYSFFETAIASLSLEIHLLSCWNIRKTTVWDTFFCKDENVWRVYWHTVELNITKYNINVQRMTGLLRYRFSKQGISVHTFKRDALVILNSLQNYVRRKCLEDKWLISSVCIQWQITSYITSYFWYEYANWQRHLRM